MTAPIGNFKAAISQLTELQKAVAENKKGMSVSISVQGTDAAPQDAPCSPADLMADARAQAQKLAMAAGAGAGSVLAMSGSTSGAYSICSLTVKFALSGGL